MTVAPKQDNIEVLFAVLSNTFDQKPASVCKSVPDFFKFLQRRAGRLDVDPDWTKDEYDAAKIKQKAIAPAGGRRKDSPLQMGYVPFDFDKLNDTDYARLSRVFRRAPFLNLQHTTASHKHACKGHTNAFRVIVPLSHTIDANDSWRVQRVLLEWAGLELGADLRDKCTEDANRLIYLPHADAEFIESRSQRLADVTELLSDAVAMGLEKRAVKVMNAANDTAGSVIDDAAFENGWDALSSGRGYEVPCPNAHLHAGAGSTSVLLDGKEPRFICMHTNNGACTVLNTMQHVALSVIGVGADKAGIARRGVSRDEIALALPDMPEDEREALRLASMPVEAAATDADLMDDVQPLYGKKDWMIRGFQNFASTFELVGESNIGKSFELLSRMACVASGVDYMGWPVRRAHCFYFDAEGGEETQTRLAALRQEFGDALEWLHVVDIQANGWDMTHADDRQKIISYILRHSAGEPVGIIAFDSLNQAMVNYRAGNFEENSSTDMGRVAAALKTLASVTGGCAGVVHHPAKSAKGTTLRTGRGSGALHGAVDFVYFLEQPQPGTLNIYTEKARGAVKKLPFGLKLVTVQLAGVEPEPEPENKPFDGSKWGIRPAADPQQYQSNSTLFAVPVRQAPFETVAGKAGRDAVKGSYGNDCRLKGNELLLVNAVQELQEENYNARGYPARDIIAKTGRNNGTMYSDLKALAERKRGILALGRDEKGRSIRGQYLIPYEMNALDVISDPDDDRDD